MKLLKIDLISFHIVSFYNFKQGVPIMFHGSVLLIMEKDKVGTILKDIRLKKELSQLNAARGIKISQSLLAQYESGKVRNVNKRTLIRILDFYEITPKYFEALLNGR